MGRGFEAAPRQPTNASFKFVVADSRSPRSVLRVGLRRQDFDHERVVDERVSRGDGRGRTTDDLHDLRR